MTPPRMEPLMEAAHRLMLENSRFASLVHFAAHEICRGTFTAAELLAAIPLADRLAMKWRLREMMDEPGRTFVIPCGLRQDADAPKGDPDADDP